MNEKLFFCDRLWIHRFFTADWQHVPFTAEPQNIWKASKVTNQLFVMSDMTLVDYVSCFIYIVNMYNILYNTLHIFFTCVLYKY